MIDDWGTLNFSQTEQAKARCRPRTPRIEGSSDSRGHKVLEVHAVWYSYTTRAASRLPVFSLAIPAKISGKGGWSNSESRRKSNTSAKSDYSIDNSRWIER